ncbi:BCNT-domain-containing protein [Pseudovirgaria hyperparasitica]|uniref:SWR1-complex protein 5 n=1 Tax=Pseudovirgaria hyperparasitica TaxID=470096 RepID=A0A6A6W3K0_9PEZI|nr:BCNT-domain-containing protein [Pseudovirgaria hyperparasitica]KAF2757183.1 BCNT-domain-containing protein [Pseudovirgaria hyperparasitica]
MAGDEKLSGALDAAQGEDEYDSASDEDFNPDSAPQDDVSSSSEDEAAANQPSAKSKKRKNDAELDSGDEATIQARRKATKKRKKGSKEAGGDDDDIVVFSDDEGGEGGLIKTRAQRRTEQKEHRKLAKVDGATIDLESVWARLSSAPVGRAVEQVASENEDGKAHDKPVNVEDSDDYMTVKRTYRFAGEVHTEEKRVLKSSKEAKLYLSQQEDKKDDSEKENADSNGPDEVVEGPPPVVRPPKRPSRFEPNPTGYVKNLDPKYQRFWPRRAPVAGTDQAGIVPQPPQQVRVLDPKAQKVNTVDKSRLDWAGFVDKEGIADELDEYGKSKQGYLARMDFLQNVDAKQEDSRREARLATQTKPQPAVVE